MQGAAADQGEGARAAVGAGQDHARCQGRRGQGGGHHLLGGDQGGGDHARRDGQGVPRAEGGGGPRGCQDVVGDGGRERAADAAEAARADDDAAAGRKGPLLHAPPHRPPGQDGDAPTQGHRAVAAGGRVHEAANRPGLRGAQAVRHAGCHVHEAADRPGARRPQAACRPGARRHQAARRPGAHLHEAALRAGRRVHVRADRQHPRVQGHGHERVPGGGDGRGGE
mmetsp:Transcript_42080/g.116283  ORF Transcript_42080/g.116283 Transcript_42080/m.116283 type:complete len:225 (-) Transcript_42080:48-722(-)